MKKLILIAIMASGLVACAQSTAPQEDSRLKEAYSACINTAQAIVFSEDRTRSEK